MSVSATSYGNSKKMECKKKNSNLSSLKKDFPNLEMDTFITDFEKFGELSYVCFVESIENMKSMVAYINKGVGFSVAEENYFAKISDYASIAVMKAGPVLVVSYGSGPVSLTIAFNDVMKLLKRAKAVDPTFLLLGSSAGIGIQLGSVVITTVALSTSGQELAVPRKTVQCSFDLDENICKQFKKVADKYIDHFPVYLGKIMSSEDFCDDGTIHDYDKQEKITYLRNLKNIGIIHFNLVSETFACICQKYGFKAGIICVTLTDGLKDDQMPFPISTMEIFKNRVYYLASLYLKQKLEEKM